MIPAVAFLITYKTDLAIKATVNAVMLATAFSSFFDYALRSFSAVSGAIFTCYLVLQIRADLKHKKVATALKEEELKQLKQQNNVQ